MAAARQKRGSFICGALSLLQGLNLPPLGSEAVRVEPSSASNVIPRRARPGLAGLQGYLAHKKTPTALGPSSGPRHRSAVES